MAFTISDNASGNRTALGLVPGTDVLAPNGTGSALIETGPKLGSLVTASGTSIDFTGVPAWVKRVTLLFSSVGTNGTAPYLVQIGTSSSIETTGYLSTSTGMDAGVGTSVYSVGFAIRSGSASNELSGMLHIQKIGSATNAWVASGMFGSTTTTASFISNGSKTLGGVLDRVRLTTGNGTDTFDSGTLNISWE